MTAGWLLGGTVGIGTLLFARLDRPAVALALRRMSAVPARELLRRPAGQRSTIFQNESFLTI